MAKFNKLLNSEIAKRLMLILLGAFLVLQFGYISAYNARNVSTRGLMGAVDDDAGWNIQKTMSTTWYNDNGWALYGPLYFRLNHTIHNLFPALKTSAEMTNAEAREQSVHFAIMSLSVLSVFGIAFLLSFILVSEWIDRLTYTFILVSAIFTSEMWSHFALRAHPDLLFSFLIALSGYFTIKMLASQYNKYFKLSAVLWGFAACVKLSIGLFLPGIIVMLRPWSKTGFKRTFMYGVWMFLGYFAIGFPQTIVLDRPFKDVFKQNKFSAPADWESIIHNLDLLRDQMFTPVIALILLALFYRGASIERFDKKTANWFLIMWAIAVFMLFSRKILSTGDHYPLPMAALFWVGLACAYTVPSRFSWMKRLDQWPIVVRSVLLLVLFYPFNWGYLPSTFALALEKQNSCREEMAKANDLIREKLKSESLILVDPYVPYPYSAKNKLVFNDWGFSSDHLAERPYQYLVLNSKFYGRFMGDEDPTPYVMIDSPNWRKFREFYKLFSGQNEVTDASGKKWRKIFTNSCGIEMFEWVR